MIPSELDGYLVQSISQYAFQNLSYIESITIPEGVETIGQGAFSGCVGITSIEIPTSVTTINSSVFSGCSGLTSVTLPETLTTINYRAFGDCTSLESIEIPDSVENIAEDAFSYCTKLNNVKLPLGWNKVHDSSGVKWTGDESPFVGCTALKEVTLPEGMTTVPKQAFRELTSLETVVLPDSIKTISAYAFYGCTGLKNITFSKNLETISSNAFYNCKSLSTLNLPNSLKTIGDYAFYGCSGFRMLNFNQDLESIGSYAFYGCNGLVSMVLNENLQTLSNDAFSNCANLTAARVPKSVTSFGADSFYNCPKLTIYCYSGSAAHMALENTNYKYFLLDEHEHEYDITVETAATCTRGGSQIKTCKICGYNYIELVDPHGHDYITNVVDPNCTEKGYTIYTCKRCDNKYNDDYVDALGHHYGEWQVRTESTCTEKGVKYRTCSVCSKEEISEISAKGHTYEINVQEPTCIERGYTEHTCSVCGYSYKDKYVNAKGHSYGEWIVDEAATVLSKGSKHRVCTECGHTETQTIAQVIVDINTNKNYGRANFTIVDAQTLEPIKNACIFISTEKDGENTFSTDSNGKVSIVLPVGKQTISVYADGCITRNTKITVKSGINDIPKIGLSEKPTYDAKITSKPMTIEEIKEAGIDTSAPENQHVYKYELKLDFDPEIDTSSIISYFNSEGDYLGGYYAGDSTGSGGSGGGTAEPSDPTYNLHYHVVTGGIWHSWCKSIEVEKGQNVSLTYHPYRDDENYVFDGWYEDDSFTKKIFSTHIKDYSTYVYGRWIYVGEGEEQKISTNPGITIPTKDEVITVYPVSEHFYLIVRGEVKWLKKMFDVEMLVVNNSNTDTLENLTASLTLPKGLSLADMNGEQQTLDKKIDNIPEGKSESVHWYVRGDVAGSYSLEARLKGKIMPFEEDIDDTFVSENQLQVWAGNTLNLHFDFPNAAYYGEDYPITITLSNVSDKTLYNINHIVQIEQGMEIYYSDGSKKEKIEKSSWKSIGVQYKRK
ncbi:leucine-rich repeat protein [Ruminococcus sp.]|mgnify:CR=1 FL=1|uniref:leucine-rich repeat protein n=1 Tax=Ruminococcus sp. TaxID=41978 RepID=UPI0040278556